MSNKAREASQDALDRMYREAGRLEPGAGLDRIVRARAEQALSEQRARSRPGTRPWVAGLATAAIAVVALLAVIQQVPSPDAAPPLPEPSAADAAGIADAAPQAPVSPPATMASDWSESSASQASEQAARTAARERRIRDEASRLSSVQVFGSRVMESSYQAATDELIEGLRALVADGRIDEARRRLEAIEKTGDDVQLPDDLAAVLRQADGADEPGGDG